MENYSMLAIQAALHGQKVFCKFLSANDTGLTGRHLYLKTIHSDFI